MRGPWSYIALAALLISPWPIVALDVKRQPNPDLVAVPATGPTLESSVSSVFSRGKYFLIVDFNNGKLQAVANPYRREKHAAGLRSAYLLLEKDVGVVVAKHIGPEPYSNLAAKGVVIFTGEATTVLDALSQYRKGLLARADRPDVKIHYGLEQQGIAAPPAPGCPLAPGAAAAPSLPADVSSGQPQQL